LISVPKQRCEARAESQKIAAEDRGGGRPSPSAAFQECRTMTHYRTANMCGSASLLRSSEEGESPSDRLTSSSFSIFSGSEDFTATAGLVLASTLELERSASG